MYDNICKHCHKQFKSRMKTYTCKDCSKLDEDYFDKIEEYLKKYPNSNALHFRGTGNYGVSGAKLS